MPQRSLKFTLLLLLVTILACIPFLWGLPGSFVFDDGYNIVENPWVQLHSLTPSSLFEAAFSPEPGGHTRVLPTLSFALDYYRSGGFDPQAFKVTNLAIHSLTTLVLAMFFRKLLLLVGTGPGRAQWASIGLALAWAMHPLQVSAVLYVVQRMQTMATLLLLLALITYLQARTAQICGKSGRTGWLATALLWLMAIACKEDAVLLPAYTLALELTVLRFRASDAQLAVRLRRGYLIATLLGAGFFVLVAVPHYWSMGDYPGRNFSSAERLLTQARVLCMYLGQILLPLPSQMPFYYDGLRPSHGLMQPVTTAASIAFLCVLMVSAWRLREARPLFAFGVFLFFAGHFITSNVVNLELAFEHRNHLPMIGILLAAGDLLQIAANRVKLGEFSRVAITITILAALATTTAFRAHSWRNDVEHARTGTRLAPASARAWNALCVAYFNAGGGLSTKNKNLQVATSACDEAARLEPRSVAALVNVITYKTLLGTVRDEDWAHYLQRLRNVPLRTENVASLWVLINNARRGVALNDDRLLDAIEIGSQRQFFGPVEFASLGYFILGHTKHQDLAFGYFRQAVRWAESPAFTANLSNDLRKIGKTEWAARLEAESNRPRQQVRSEDGVSTAR